MENMSKALLMAAGVLIGVMTLAIIVIFYQQGGELNSSYETRREQEAIQSYNTPFTKLLAIGNSGNTKMTVYNVISAVNYAKNLNENLELPYDESNYNYIKVYIFQNENLTQCAVDSDGKSLKDIAGKDFIQEDYHKIIKNMSNYNFGLTLKYNEDGKVNIVNFYIK